ncbi:MAG: hypothetical protein ACLPYY_11050, partial [Acidimicrobiales bacterium]
MPAAALPPLPRAVVLVVGVTVLVVTAAGVIRVLIVPRPPSRGLSTVSMRVVRSCFRSIAHLSKSYRAQDRVLVLSEPVALMALLVTWILLLVIGFTLVNWGMSAPSLVLAFEQAGSSVFTLGFVTGHSYGSQALDFIAAGSGLVLVAVEIAYLPALYGSYNRRETLVTLLEARAGAPAWGPELIIRHHLVGMVDNMPGLFADWERWGADVAESHTSYPSLIYLRSPRPLNSWVVSLMAVLDASAILLAIDPEGAPMEARMCVRMGFTCLRDVATVAGVAFDPDPSPDDDIDLPREEFETIVDRLESLALPMSRPRDEMWMHFRGWRVNYESVGYALAGQLDAPPARWTGPRRLLRGDTLSPERPVDRQPGGAT